MSERTDRRRGTPSMRAGLTCLLVASGIGIVGVVPALAAEGAAAPAVKSDHDSDRGRGHDRWFRDHGDVRYVWFRVCDGTATTATTSTTTAPDTTTEAVATDALAAAVEGAAAETATTTSTTTDTTTETSSGTATADDDPDAGEYPTFVVVPMPKDEAASLRKLDDRPCYDLTAGAPRTTATTTTADTTTEAATATDTTTTTTAPAAVGTTG